jgi:hypothetical protein
MEAAQNILMDMELDEIRHRHEMELLALDLEEARRRLNELIQARIPTELRAPYSGIITYNRPLRDTYVNIQSFAMFINNNENVFVEYLGDIIPQNWLFNRANPPRIEARINGRVYELTHTPVTFSLPERTVRNMRGQGAVWRFDFLPDERDLPPLSSYASIVFYTVSIPDALYIPVNALLYTAASGNHVYSIINGETVLIPVRIGARTDSFVQILEGLEEGDEIIVR